jgi:Fe2+ transport system protein B
MMLALKTKPSTEERRMTIVLAGLENVGKSALFRGLTGQATGDEANFRGSTVVCRRGRLTDRDIDLVDTPGIRLQADSLTTRLALEQITAGDAIVLVVRATDAKRELQLLLQVDVLAQCNSILVLTFDDMMPPNSGLAEQYARILGLPVIPQNATSFSAEARSCILEALTDAAPIRQTALADLVAIPAATTGIVSPRTPFEHAVFGPWIAALALVLLFSVPIWLAFQIADILQPWVDEAVIAPMKAALNGLPPLPTTLLVGRYGLLTLGWYSFLWAFPVVVLIGLATAMAQESGLKDRITASLDPWLRHVGLSGRDLIPVLAGFGCNVVAVFQSRSCSLCTRKSCVSLITFGSACSYQIGASLSLFGSSGHSWLFGPYILLLFLVGAVHTRLWHGDLTPDVARPLSERSFLQWPRWEAVRWRLRAVTRQFLWQAMPIFLAICLVAAFLEETGLLSRLASTLSAAMAVFDLPADVAPGIVFSILRKDGLLVLNQGEGDLLQNLSAVQVFVVVWLASTLTACLVTLWTVGRELGVIFALTIAGRQALTALISTLALVWSFAAIEH